MVNERWSFVFFKLFIDAHWTDHIESTIFSRYSSFCLLLLSKWELWVFQVEINAVAICFMFVPKSYIFQQDERVYMYVICMLYVSLSVHANN